MGSHINHLFIDRDILRVQCQHASLYGYQTAVLSVHRNVFPHLTLTTLTHININQNKMSTKTIVKKKMSTENKCPSKTNVNRKQMSTENKCQQQKCQQKTNVKKKKCQQKTNVNRKQMLTENKCQPKTNVNKKQMSTKNKCQQKTDVDQK